MKRQDLEHLIRAAASLTNEYEFVVIGSQSILGAYPNAPDDLLVSQEADIYPRHRPELADLIDGSIGEESPFHATFGYYAQGVGPNTAVLPEGWEGRLVKVQSPNTDLKIGYCLEPHDLAVSKLVAARPKDLDFVAAMFDAGLVDFDIVLDRLNTTNTDPARLGPARSWMERWRRQSFDAEK
jgi:hypothetical protein